MRVAMTDLLTQFRESEHEVRAGLERVMACQRFVLGAEVDSFEKEMAQFCSVRHAIGVSSGTDALLLALMGLGVGAGDEVVTTGYSFVATAEVVVRLQARLVLVDIDPRTFNIDPHQAAAVLGPRTRAIIAVHLFGQCADMTSLSEMAGKRGIPVIEDAAQAIGSCWHGRRAGGIGHCGCFSFFPTKNLGGFGDGGMLVTDDDGLAETCRTLRSHGADRPYHHGKIGGNFRLDEIQAAVLRAKLPRLATWTRRRQMNADRYDRLLADLPGVQTPFRATESEHVFHQYVIRTAATERDPLRRHLAVRGVESAIYYPVPLHQQPCFRDLRPVLGHLPNAEAAANETLAVPVHPGLTKEDIKVVSDAIREYFHA